jgi:hypothetical protein
MSDAPAPLQTLETRLIRIEAMVEDIKDLLTSWESEPRRWLERLKARALQ